MNIIQLEIGVEKTVQYDIDGVTVDLSHHTQSSIRSSVPRP